MAEGVAHSFRDGCGTRGLIEGIDDDEGVIHSEPEYDERENCVHGSPLETCQRGEAETTTHGETDTGVGDIFK